VSFAKISTQVPLAHKRPRLRESAAQDGKALWGEGSGERVCRSRLMILVRPFNCLAERGGQGGEVKPVAFTSYLV